VAQYKDFKKSQRVKTIVNNRAADSHIFLLRHSPFLVCITLKQEFENFQQLDWSRIKSNSN